jgi:hypothetical protein
VATHLFSIQSRPIPLNCWHHSLTSFSCCNQSKRRLNRAPGCPRFCHRDQSHFRLSWMVQSDAVLCSCDRLVVKLAACLLVEFSDCSNWVVSSPFCATGQQIPLSESIQEPVSSDRPCTKQKSYGCSCAGCSLLTSSGHHVKLLGDHPTLQIPSREHQEVSVQPPCRFSVFLHAHLLHVIPGAHACAHHIQL